MSNEDQQLPTAQQYLRIYTLVATILVIVVSFSFSSDGPDSGFAPLYVFLSAGLVLGFGFLIEKARIVGGSNDSKIIAAWIALYATLPIVYVVSGLMPDVQWSVFGDTYTLSGFVNCLYAIHIAYVLFPIISLGP